MKFTTSRSARVKADVRVSLMRSYPIRDRRLFLGIHLDFSMHQAIVYLGLASLFVEIYGINTPEPTIDKVKSLFKWRKMQLIYHHTNHKPHDYFFNIGVTYESGSSITFFLWKLQLIYGEEERRMEGDCLAYHWLYRFAWCDDSTYPIKYRGIDVQ